MCTAVLCSLERGEPKRSLLTTILELCRKFNKIPPSWKESSTILIHKKGDVDQIRNWRPICLQKTIYKLHAAIMAKRLDRWAISSKAISRSQKGFLPYDGIAQHSFLLRSIMEDSRRKRKNLNVAWIDLKDALSLIHI